MRAPLSWLRDYAPLDATVEELATALSELGLVVEGVERIGAGLGDVIVARVAAIRAHPDADRIRLVDVDTGGPETVQIACGAWNFSEGDLVPLAPVGAVLPGGFEISRRKMRGQWSNGMLCSASELELPDDPASADGLMILAPGIAAPGTSLVEALGLEPDVVFDLDVSPNRPDALCMAGVARDLAARLGETWSPPSNPPAPEVAGGVPDATISVESGDLCPRFSGTVLEGVPTGSSPQWIARRLALAGMRPISAVVDVSNYVMLDLGQPNHAYDLDRLGGGGILVRRGRPGEILETLDGVERTLEADDCVIADATGKAVGVAGVMGGADAEISDSTTRVLLEAAWFTPMAVARTGKRLGLNSEARSRFERGVDPHVTLHAVERFVGLLASIPGGEGLRRGKTNDVVDVASLPAGRSVSVRTGRVNAMLGTDLGQAEIVSLLAPLGFEATPAGGGVDTLDVTIPSWRLDAEREIDVVEEVARLWGYGHIPRTVPSGARGSAGGLTERQHERRKVRDLLAGAGFDEAWTTTFLAPGDLEAAGLDASAVEVENPLDRSESILRTSLIPGLLKAVRFNRDRQAGDVFLFEIGRVFDLPTGQQPTPVESEHLGVIVAPLGLGGAGTHGAGGTAVPDAATAAVSAWRLLRDSLRLAGTRLEAGVVAGWHPARTVVAFGQRGERLGVAGEIDPDVVAAYGLAGRVGFVSVSLDLLAEAVRLPMESRPVSRFPASDVDLALVVKDEVQAVALRETLRSAAEHLVEDVWLFDTFRSVQVGEGLKSLTFRMRLRAADHTLGDSEIAEARSAAIDAARSTHSAVLRGA